jgi:cytochrome c
VSEPAGWALAALALVLLLGSAAGADPARGARVFQRCDACHSIAAGEDKLPGPNLSGVLGRRAGTLPGFAFSPAMIAAGAGGLRWTRTALDAFLADPQGVVPGTEMGMPGGLPAPDDRRDVIDYLARTTAAGARHGGGH